MAEVFCQRGLANRRNLNKFFKCFHTENKKFVVYLAIKNRDVVKIKNYKLLSQRVIELKKAPKGIRNLVTSDGLISDGDSYLVYDAQGRDKYQASLAAKKIFNTFLMTTILEERGASVRIRDYLFIRGEKLNKVSLIKDSSAHIQPVAKSIGKTKSANILKNIQITMRMFDEHSIARIATALDSVSLANKSTNVDNQIVLIWSAFEILFGDPPKGMARAPFYTECIAPCVMLNYPWRYVSAVFNRLNLVHRKLIKEVCDNAQIESAISPLDRFIYLVLHPDYRDFHRDLTGGMLEDQLGLQMLTRFFKDFGNAKNLSNVINSHQNRVLWQLNRIYRSRNDFIHSGFVHSFSKNIVANAYEYFKTSMQSLLHHRSLMAGTIPDSVRTNVDVEMVLESIVASFGKKLQLVKDLASSGDQQQKDLVLVFKRT